MTTLQRLSVIALLSMVISACVTTGPDVGQQPQVRPLTRQHAVTDRISLSICRPKSLVRFAESPDVYVNEAKVGEVANGSAQSTLVYEGDSFSLKTSASPLLFRFTDEELITGRVGAIPMFLVVEGRATVSQGISVLFGGAIAESTRQSLRGGNTGNWSIKVVDESEYYKAGCAVSRNQAVTNEK